MTSFDFDEWAKLYRENPVEFERKRKEFLDAEISKAPEKHRIALRLLQSECDDLCEDLPPMQAAGKMSKLMVNKLTELQTELINLNSACLQHNELLKSHTQK